MYYADHEPGGHNPDSETQGAQGSLGTMNFRRRVTLLAAAAVAIAVLLASALTYLLVAQQLRGQVDAQLRDRAHGLPFIAHRLASKPEDLQLFPGVVPSNLFGGLSPRPNQVRGYQQLVSSSGRVLSRSSSAQVTLPVSAATRVLAVKGGRPLLGDARVDGIHMRILAVPLRPGFAVQFAQPLTEVDHLLRKLRLILALLALGGIALAALLGRLVAGAVVLPVRRLTRTAEHVARTRDLSGRIAAGRADEIGRLAVSFNAMLDALERSMGALDASVHAQRQLVADASHELRTPVTSVRTNIEILQQTPDLDPEERRQLFAEVVEQLEELTLLINDLIDLARGEEPAADTEDVRLDLIVAEAVERTRRHSPATPLHTALTPTLLVGVPARLGRAVNNLIDNAVKYSPPGSPVEIALAGGELEVRDHGRGISAEDLPHVFDRFYRGAESRGRPGSGLGLAIVRQVVEQHGGTISAEGAPGGGTVIRMRLPSAEALPVAPAPGASYSGVG
jgi:two-component system, OmpR family, sensor histidine kinase MprB